MKPIRSILAVRIPHIIFGAFEAFLSGCHPTVCLSSAMAAAVISRAAVGWYGG